MNNDINKELEKLLIGKSIGKIDFERGLGLIPAKFIIKFADECPYRIEIESDFRAVIIKNHLLL